MLAYCDLIASKIKRALDAFDADFDPVTLHPGKVNWDLHPEGGYMVSTKKTINVMDEHGKRYRVTVEEVGDER